MAPTAKGSAVTKSILAAANLHPQTFQTQRGTGTRLPVIPKPKPRGTAISSSHLLQKVRTLKSLMDSSMFGGIEILSSAISRTSLIGLVVVGRVSDGDWTTVR